MTLAAGAQIPAANAGSNCNVSVDVTTSVPGAFTHTINAGQLQTTLGNNPQNASDTLTVAASLPTLARAIQGNCGRIERHRKSAPTPAHLPTWA